MQMNIAINGLDNILRKLDPSNCRKAITYTLKRSASTGKTKVSEQIRTKFNIKKQDLDKKIAINLQGLLHYEAKVILTGDPISMTYFNPVQIQGQSKLFISKNRGLAARRTRSKRGGGVQVKIMKSHGTTLRSAFMATGKGNVPLVFRRLSPKRYPIKVLKVIKQTSILKKPENIQAVRARINEQMMKNLLSQVKHFGGTLEG